jgi:dolichyl-diphosphooligosaccharide---protein glycosyltransferase subunit DDOST/WBP1
MMMMKIIVALVFVCVCLSLVDAKGANNQDRVLVLMDDVAREGEFKLFFAQMRSRGFAVDVRRAGDNDNRLDRYGDWLYDTLVLFCPRSEYFGGEIDVDKILDFVDAGNNVLQALDTGYADSASELALEFGFVLDNKEHGALDHLHFDRELDREQDGAHSVLVSNRYVRGASAIFFHEGDDDEVAAAPTLFSGVLLTAADDTELVVPVLGASPSAYSHSERPVNARPSGAVGSAAILVGAVQARNNARIVVSGSLELFSDRFMSAGVDESGDDGARAPLSGNRQLAASLFSWLAQESGVIRATNVCHHRRGETEPAERYRIKDDIVYEVDIERWDGVANEWRPFAADDIMLEFIMLDPHVRLPLKHDGAGHFHLDFRVPDVYGVYTFALEYRALGLSAVDERLIVPIRPFRHDEYDRFIPAAFPYYTGAFSIMIGFAFFSFVLFFSINK